MTANGSRLAALAAIGALAACAPRSVKPDDMGARAHRAAALDDHAKAAVEARAYDPAKQVKTVEVVINGSSEAVVKSESNPTQSHLDAAAALTAHAKAHERAAAELEGDETRECVGVAVSARTACPWLGALARSEDIPEGVRLRPADGATIERLASTMRCHYAFAEARGFDETVSCPLYFKGVRLQLSSDGSGVEVVGDTTGVAREIQRRAGASVSGK